MTAKQLVLRKYPDAVCLRAGKVWNVWIDTEYPIGSSARSAAVAWKLAYMRITL